jgi:hypothetical protein
MRSISTQRDHGAHYQSPKLIDWALVLSNYVARSSDHFAGVLGMYLPQHVFFAFEMMIEGSLCNACPIGNLLDGCGMKSSFTEQGK